jgi:hypothetical protein
MSELSEFLKRERDAFELFKEAYKVGFPEGASGPPVPPELNLPAPQLAAEADAEAARAALLFVALDTTFFAAVEEVSFAEIEWL